MTDLADALRTVAFHLCLDAKSLVYYAEEDQIGGYTWPENAAWPGGCIWGNEGQLYYALTRVLRPTTVVELGTNFGCSTAHWCSAMKNNGTGILHCIDLTFERLCTNSPLLVKHQGDGLSVSRILIEQGVVPDILYEDGPHTTEFTRDFIKLWLPIMKPGALILVHDIEFKPCAAAVQQGFRDGIGGNFFIYRVLPSWNGVGYWQKT
jgi:cephalosporin hydroxylase